MDREDGVLQSTGLQRVTTERLNCVLHSCIHVCYSFRKPKELISVFMSLFTINYEPSNHENY